MQKNTKALSPVIATILLMLLSVAAIAILAAFVIPFIKDKLETTKCFDTLNQFSIDAVNGYACYTSSGNTEVKITIHSDMDSDSIYGFRLAVYDNRTSEIFDITSADGLPMKGTEKTYTKTLDTILLPEKAVIAIMLSENSICEQTDTSTLEECA